MYYQNLKVTMKRLIKHQKEVWTEYSKEFSEATGVKYYWAHQEQEDGIYYFSVNMSFKRIERCLDGEHMT